MSGAQYITSIVSVVDTLFEDCRATYKVIIDRIVSLRPIRRISEAAVCTYRTIDVFETLESFWGM